MLVEQRIVGPINSRIFAYSISLKKVGGKPLRRLRKIGKDHGAVPLVSAHEAQNMIILCGDDLEFTT
jgi:hypothetical protein